MNKPTQNWVPDTTGELERIDELADFLAHLDVAVLTGAGCSTESGIPDYRGPKTRDSDHSPITYQQFTRSEATRRRYWARSMVGWPRFRAAEPNRAHRALARLERAGVVGGVITQNVDRLHQAAGSKNVVELHGALAEVRCLDCGWLIGRDPLQRQLRELNPTWGSEHSELRPDGDAELPDELADELHEDLRVPACETCSGTLKPDVVFFGENVAKSVVDAAWRVLYDADALLVVGSSLTVWSGYRFLKKAVERRMPTAILNLGPTRGDEEAWLKVEARAGEGLGRLADRLCCGEGF